MEHEKIKITKERERIAAEINGIKQLNEDLYRQNGLIKDDEV